MSAEPATAGPGLADRPEDLTPAWLQAALRAGGALPAAASVAEASTAVIGTGQVGLVVRAELVYDGPAAGAPASVVVKLPSDDPGSRQLSVAMGMCEAEVRFYEQIAPRLGPEVPVVYWAGVEPDTGRFTLVIEDLTGTAIVGDAVAGGDLAQVRMLLGTLARLQAPTWDDRSLLDRGWLSLERTHALFAAVAPSLPEFVSRYGERLDPAHLALAERVAPHADGLAKRLWQAPFVVAHGDLRLDNVLFGRAAGAPPVSVIDWQAAKLAPPGLDVAIALSSCLPVEERRAHEDSLLAHYHAALLAAGVSGFSLADARASYRVGWLYPFLMVIVGSVALVRTERGDRMWTQMFTAAAAGVQDTDAAALVA